MSALYIHIPYCHSKCSYCDFYSTPRAERAEAYIDALVGEYGLRRHEVDGAPLRTIYIGGGTPSSLPPSMLGRIVEAVDTSAVEEFTVEVNPEDVTPDMVASLRDMGVSRISMGVQSLDDAELRAIGRRHSAARAVEAAGIIARCFDNFSLDVIFGLPGQTLESLGRTLSGILDLNPAHISAYLLSYEPGTRLYAQLLAGKVVEATDEQAERMYALVEDTLATRGYDHYEISNYARPGCRSLHNSSYWDMTPYLGLGVSAHSFDGLTRRFNPSDISGYISAINAGRCCYIIDEENDRQRFNDRLIVSLRTSRGLDPSILDAYPRPLVDEFYRRLEPLARCGRLIVDRSSVTIPSRSWLTSDAVLRDLILDTD